MMRHGGDRKSKNISLTKSTIFSIKVPKAMIDELNRRAEKKGLNRSEYVRDIFQRELNGKL